MNEKLILLRCSNCGGAMRPDQGAGSYMCDYCGSKVPLTENNYFKVRLPKYRHRQYENLPGKLNIMHVMPSMEVACFPESNWLKREKRFRSIDKTLSLLTPHDAGYATVPQISFTCPNCGGEVEGQEIQNMFTCGYCSNQIAKADVLKTGAYNKKYIMGVGAKNIPYDAIPFSITKENAARHILNLIDSDTRLSNIAELKTHVSKSIQANYAPFTVNDLTALGMVKSFLSERYYYQERINWACPETMVYDVYLLDRLEPWDFSSIAPFDPAFMDGNTRVASVTNNVSRSDMIDALLFHRLEEDIEAVSGKKAELVLCGSDLRKHNISVLLPIYWVDCREYGDISVLGAVNGQTGKAVVQILGKSARKDALITGDPMEWREFSADSTMINKPIQVKPEKGSMKWAKKVD